jgi:DNA-binding response OmpR family regulator
MYSRPLVAASPESKPTVLVVDDERDIADLYALHLKTEYDPIVAYGGREALELLDERVAAVLLDRRMPDMHGDEVLATLRERGYDIPVIMVTAVDPQLNILEMDFDDYLTKPIDEETLRQTLDQHIDQDARNPKLDEFLGIMSKLLVLEDEHAQPALEDNDEYRRLKRRASTLADELEDEVDDLEAIVRTHESIHRSADAS